RTSMDAPPLVRILRSEFGAHPETLPLNPALRPGVSTVKIVLEVVWAPPDPVAALEAYETALAAALPGLHRHECRGPSQYHVLARRRGNGIAECAGPIEAPLSLAHLLEHLIIDAVSFV